MSDNDELRQHIASQTPPAAPVLTTTTLAGPAYFKVRGGLAAETREVDSNVYLDFDGEGRLLGIEVLCPVEVRDGSEKPWLPVTDIEIGGES